MSTKNPFEFTGAAAAADNSSRRLDYTPILITTSNQRAQDLMVNVGKNPELFDLANKAIDGGNPTDLIALLNAVYDSEQLKTDAQILKGCDDDQLSRLLESRRSDRSKAKAKGPRSNATVCRTYIASMYAELIIREYWQKPYTGSSSASDYDINELAKDTEAVGKKIRSLQSKKSRLVKLAQFDPKAKADLKEVEAEIERLNELRPNTRTTSKTVIKSDDLSAVRELLKTIDASQLEADEQARLLAMIEKLG